MDRTEDDLREKVKNSMHAFLSSRVHDFKSHDVDDIVLSYVVGVLHDLKSAPDDEKDAFDVDSFCETLTAYMPQTETVAAEEITEWMFELVQEQRDSKNGSKKISFDLRSVFLGTAAVPNNSKAGNGSSSNGTSRTNSESSDFSNDMKKRTARCSETSDGDTEEFQQMVGQLFEMFPGSCEVEICHCLTLMAGDLERAAQLIIHREEEGRSLQPTDRKAASKRVPNDADDRQVKDRIFGKYGYVDKDEDSRYHRPTVKRGDDKKLIRYRDGKIVSTKGERFTQVSKQESDEMKKNPYVNMPVPSV